MSNIKFCKLCLEDPGYYSDIKQKVTGCLKYKEK
jgi:hypothetical protein